MPLISGFRSTTIWKAFILNALASSLIILVAITVKDKLDTYKYTKSEQSYDIIRKTSFKNLIFTFVITFVSSLTAYIILYILFGYGGGFLVNN